MPNNNDTQGQNAAASTTSNTNGVGVGGLTPSTVRVTVATTVTSNGIETPTFTVIVSTISATSSGNSLVPGQTNSAVQPGPVTQGNSAPTPSGTTTSNDVGKASSSTAVANGADSTPSATGTTASNGFSTGELAGAVVGSLIGAAIITFLLTWLFFRRRNRRDQRNQRSLSHRSRDHRSPGRHEITPVAAAGMKEKSLSSSGDSEHSWQAYLPQSADDQTIKRDVKTLFDQIELHVDNYYTRANIRIDSGTREALSQFDDDNLPDSIEAFMANPQTTLATIKHCIAKTLVARMSPGYDRASLLPAYLAEPTKLNSSMPPGEQAAAQQAYSQWRLLNAYLHPRPEQDRNYQQRRDAVANDISNDISDTFAAWQGPQENIAGLKQHERSLVQRAADVATLIMSQASAYEFWWSTSSQSFVVFPGFLKTTDDRGRTLDQPQTLIQPALAR